MTKLDLRLLLEDSYTLDIIKYPHDVLRQKAELYNFFDDSELGLTLKTKMLKTMLQSTSAIGLAGNQVNIPLRVIAVHTIGIDKLGISDVMFNPQIALKEQVKPRFEGCLSFPDATRKVDRYNQILVMWQDEAGLVKSNWFGGMTAVCIQHEIDHLNGILFIDHEEKS